MDIKELAPWNWFRNEEETGSNVPVVQLADTQPFYTGGGAMNLSSARNS